MRAVAQNDHSLRGLTFFVVPPSAGDKQASAGPAPSAAGQLTQRLRQRGAQTTINLINPNTILVVGEEFADDLPVASCLDLVQRRHSQINVAPNCSCEIETNEELSFQLGFGQMNRRRQLLLG